MCATVGSLELAKIASHMMKIVYSETEKGAALTALWIDE
jgi:hypothetical protein